MSIEGFTEESFYLGARLRAHLRNGSKGDVIPCPQNLLPHDLSKKIEAWIATGVDLLEQYAALVAQERSDAVLAMGEVRFNLTCARGYTLPEDKGAYADGRTEPTK